MPRKAKEKSTKAEEPKKDLSDVEAWVNKINSAPHFKGVVQVCMANQLRTPYHLRRPTGITSVDIALGGGFHAGGTAEIHGEESVGKTYLAYRTAAEIQRNYGDAAKILIFGTEIRPDKGFARMAGFHLGYSPDEVEEYNGIRAAYGMEPFTPEQVADLTSQTGKVAYIGAATADLGLDAVVEALRDGFYQLVIIESLGAFLTPAQDEEDVGKRHYAGSSMLVTNFQNKVYPLFVMDRKDGTLLETTIIGVNQARANMDAGMYGTKTRAAASAFAWKHGQLVSVKLEKGAAIRDPADKKKITGREVRWSLSKGKAGTHDGKNGVYIFRHLPRLDPVFWSDVQTKDMRGADLNDDLIETAVTYGVIQRSGAWYEWPEAGIRANGTDRFAATLEETPELLVDLRRECFIAAGVMVRFK
jgi:RecA/RadA recombinase